MDPGGPKLVGANIRYFNVNLTFFMFNKKCIFWGKGMLTNVT